MTQKALFQRTNTTEQVSKDEKKKNKAFKSYWQINVRENRRGNQECQFTETCNIRYTRQKTKTRKTKEKTQHNMCWTPLYTNKHK